MEEILGARVVILGENRVIPRRIGEPRDDSLACCFGQVGDDQVWHVVRHRERVGHSCLALPRSPYEQRYANGFLVDVLGVFHQAVFPEVLAVVRRDHDHRVVVDAALFQSVQQGPHFLVQVGDGRVVLVDDAPHQIARNRPFRRQDLALELFHEPAVVLGGRRIEKARTRARIVRSVCVDVIDEEKEGPLGSFQPVEDPLVQGVRVSSFHVVGTEPLIQPPKPCQIGGVACESGRLVALRGERLGERHVVTVQRPDVVSLTFDGDGVGAVHERRFPGEHRGVRGYRPRRRRHRARVAGRGAGEGIDVRGRRALVPVAPEPRRHVLAGDPEDIGAVAFRLPKGRA